MFNLTRPLPFGLDISDFYLRLVQLSQKGGKLNVTSLGEVPLPPGCIIDGEIVNEEKTVIVLNQLLNNTKPKRITSREVIAVLPEPKTFIKPVEIIWPAIDSSGGNKPDQPINYRDIIIQQIKKIITYDVPIETDESKIAYQILSGRPGRPGEKIKLLVGISTKKITESYTRLLEAAELIPAALEIEAVAISRALINQSLSKTDMGAKIIIDLGATRTGFILFNNNVIEYSLSIPVSGKQLTDVIAQELKINLPEAEKIKKSYDLSSATSDSTGQALNPLIDLLVVKVKEATDFCRERDNNQCKIIKEIVLCGGGANFNGIENLFKNKLNIATTKGNPWINFNAKLIPPISADQSLSYTTAIGLALHDYYVKS